MDRGSQLPRRRTLRFTAPRRLMLVIVMPLQMANYLVMGSIAAIYVPGRTRELQTLLRRTATLFFLPSLLGLSLVVLFGGPILSVLYGDYYRAAAWPLACLAIGQIAWPPREAPLRAVDDGATAQGPVGQRPGRAGVDLRRVVGGKAFWHRRAGRRVGRRRRHRKLRIDFACPPAARRLDTD